MKPIIFSLFQATELISNVIKNFNAEIGDVILRAFPDGESYIKINSAVKNRHIIVMTSLDHANEKLLPLLFFARTVKELGAKKIGLVAPYLAYMRQDKQFKKGECVSSRDFAAILSHYFDWLMTIDPHLHRYKSLDEIYTIPTVTLQSKEKIIDWINTHIKNPVIIGPDIESKQWAENIAKDANIPYLILQKVRRGDSSVEVSVPRIERFASYIPVLIDDIISTGKTMLATIAHLKKLNMQSVVCVGIHAIFANDSYEALLKADDIRIVTCNTINHVTNKIDLSSLIIDKLSTDVF